jgi:hypothetical protein
MCYLECAQADHRGEAERPWDHHRARRILTGLGSMSLLIALTGATGFIAQYLLRHRLRVLPRRPTEMPVQASSDR